MRTLLSASGVQLPHVWTVCGKFLCCYDVPVISSYTVGVEGTPGSIQTTQSESPQLTVTLRILSLFHSSYWIETVTAPVFNRAGTATLGGLSTVKLAWFSSVLLAFRQQINNRAEPY